MILVSAFAPFDIDPENSSELILNEARPSLSSDIASIVLPVSFSRSWIELKKAIDMTQPKLVIALGQADSRSKISIENIALNCLEARISDNDGTQPKNQEIHPGEPLALRSTWKIAEVVEILSRQGLKAEASFHAGTFVCNALMYQLLRDAGLLGYSAGFIHFPLLIEQNLGTGREDLRPRTWLTAKDGARALDLLISLLKKQF